MDKYKLSKEDFTDQTKSMTIAGKTVKGTLSWQNGANGAPITDANLNENRDSFQVRHYYRSALDNSWVRSGYSPVKTYRVR